MHTTSFTVQRDGEAFDLEIEYSVARYYPAQAYGPPEDCYPAEGGEIEELTAYLDGEVFALTPAETRIVEERIYDRHEYD